MLFHGTSEQERIVWNLFNAIGKQSTKSEVSPQMLFKYSEKINPPLKV